MDQGRLKVGWRETGSGRGQTAAVCLPLNPVPTLKPQRPNMGLLSSMSAK